jgi:hypothetical protein
MQYALHEVKLINHSLVTDVFLFYFFVVMLFISHPVVVSNSFYMCVLEPLYVRTYDGGVF